jgi:hypothetical protein
MVPAETADLDLNSALIEDLRWSVNAASCARTGEALADAPLDNGNGDVHSTPIRLPTSVL